MTRAHRLGCAVAAGAVTLLGAVGCGSPPPTATPDTPTSSSAPSSSPAATAPASLARSFAALPGGLAAHSGVAVAPVGGQAPARAAIWSWGVLRTAPAWSTIKVPMAVAAGNAHPDAARRALQQSDNTAAATLWTALGGGATAAARVQAELRAGGDAATTVQYADVRPPYTPYGQTAWSLADSASYVATLPCRPAAAAAYALMGGVAADQRWGLGTIGASAFKGGWGPQPQGRYLARQIGVLQVGGGRSLAVSLVTITADYDTATAELGALARFVRDHRAELPAGRC